MLLALAHPLNYLFCNKNGVQMHDIRKSFSTALVKSGINNFRFHDLRHTGSAHLIESGWSTMELMQQAGWSSQQMAKRYSNISAKHLANKMKKIKDIKEIIIAILCIIALIVVTCLFSVDMDYQKTKCLEEGGKWVSGMIGGHMSYFCMPN